MKKIIGIGIIFFLGVILLIQIFDNNALVNNYGVDQSIDNIEKDDEYSMDKYTTENTEKSPKVIQLDDDYSVEIKLDINEKVIYNIFFYTYYQGSEEIWGKEHANICDVEPKSHECNSYVLDTALNNIALYIVCKSKFPEEHLGLTDEQYENLKKEYEIFVANPTVEYTGTSGKCISDRGY